MASITSWTRLEPRARSNALDTSLQARIHDPLWLLARQWQFGEFQGEDAASLVAAKLSMRSSRLESYRPGHSNGDWVNSYDCHSTPLETLVEREYILQAREDGSVNRRLAAEAGLHFLRTVGSKWSADDRSALLKHFALAPLSAQTELDGAAKRFLSIVAMRVPDGAKLYNTLAPLCVEGQPFALPDAEPFNKISSLDKDAILAWLHWYETLFSEPVAVTENIPGTDAEGAWIPERMEYAFAVLAPTKNASGEESELVLVADEYYDGHLDWQSFEVDNYSEQHLLSGEQHTLTALPTPIRFRGMPASRFWEFEDAGVNFGNIEAAPEDLARLLLTEFALIYGNDHFLIPIDLPVGTICRIASLEVTDTFGITSPIPAAHAADQQLLGKASWRMFHLSKVDEGAIPSNLPADFLFLPPVLGWSLQSAPLEEVSLIQDEMANLAWAVERVVESPAGRPSLNRFEAMQETQRRREMADPDLTTSQGGPPEYHLATSVPPYWIPLLPVYKPKEGSKPRERDIWLQLGNFNKPLGRLLQPKQNNSGQTFCLHEEEVPREGAVVTRAYQYARWIDGSTHLWIGRHKRTGRGEGSSRLAFDRIVQP